MFYCPLRFYYFRATNNCVLLAVIVLWGEQSVVSPRFFFFRAFYPLLRIFLYDERVYISLVMTTDYDDREHLEMFYARSSFLL